MRKGKIIWLTGLPCSGKTTLGKIIRDRLGGKLLDGDVIRGSYLSNWDFTPEGREKHLLRVATVARLLSDAGVDTVCAFVSPLHSIQENIKEIIPESFWVYVHCSAEVCAERDVKGMWAKAKAGEIPNFTGYNAPYEAPPTPEISVLTDEMSVDECIDRIFRRINEEFSALGFIGRWQAPNGMHDGHKEIIKRAREKKDPHGRRPVVIFVRDMIKDDKNPYSTQEVKERLELQWANDNVVIQVIPDIRGIYYGRGVGYDIQQIDVPDKIAQISATELRKKASE